MKHLTRREMLRYSGAGLLGCSASGWLPNLARAAEGKKTKSVILLWMAGGPSQLDTFDPKPGHENGGEFKPLKTNVPGLHIGEHFPKLSKFGDQLAVVRTLNSREGDHGRATYLNRTGNTPLPALQYPTFGSLLSKELGDPTSELPNFVAVSPFRFFNSAAYSPGFLGPKYAPLIVGEGGFQANNEQLDEQLKVQDLVRPESLSEKAAVSRMKMLHDMEHRFSGGREGVVTESHQLAYRRAVSLMRSDGAKAFDLTQESDKTRDRYGRTMFGQGCLLARRLVERGVPFVEVGLSNWDTHGQNFESVKNLCGTLDPAWSSLMEDLKESGRLDDTLVVWMGEFGRTPKINRQQGRDHWPNSYCAVMAGGGINGGRAIGETNNAGDEIKDRPVAVPDFLATVCGAVGVDHTKTNDSNIGRPIRIVDLAAEPIKEVLS